MTGGTTEARQDVGAQAEAGGAGGGQPARTQSCWDGPADAGQVPQAGLRGKEPGVFSVAAPPASSPPTAATPPRTAPRARPLRAGAGQAASRRRRRQAAASGCALRLFPGARRLGSDWTRRLAPP